MAGLGRRQLGDVALDRLDDRPPQRPDLGLDPANSGPSVWVPPRSDCSSGWCSVEMQAAQPLGERVERGQSSARS